MATTETLRAHFAPPLNQSWSRRAYHASVVVGDYVYIDMGEVAIGTVPFTPAITNAKYTPYAINCTLSIPLQSWTDPSTVVFSVIIKPPAPTYDFTSLWNDESEDSLYSFGGEESYLDSKLLDLAIWKLELNGGGGGTWYQNTSYGDPPFSGQPGITRPFGGAATQSNTSGFYIGGYSSSRSSPQTQNQQCFIPTPGLIEYSFGDGSWTNTTTGTALSQSGSFNWGGTEYVPGFGPNGLLVMWGGDTSNSTIYIPGTEPRNMDTMTLLDPVTKASYQQTTTGPVPSPRIRFCTIGAADPTPLSSATHTGTYDIFMYGGYAGTLGAGNEQYDEVWVLTLPAFTWLRVIADHTSARIGHTCHLVGNRQLLSIGGVDAAQTDAWSTPDYTHVNGLGVFDVTASQWTPGFNASAAPYRRSSALQSYYDTNAAYPHPWTNTSLRDLFIPSSSSANSTPNLPSTTPTPIPTNNSTHTATIAGATIALLLLLLSILLLFYYYHIRRTLAPNNQIAEMSAEPKRYEFGEPSARREGRQQRCVVELEGAGVAGEIAC